MALLTARIGKRHMFAKIASSSLCSAVVAGLAAVAMLLPVITPGLSPELVGAHAFHGHVSVDGIVEPHTHDPAETNRSDLIFTTDDSGSTNGALVFVAPSVEQVNPSAEFMADLVPDQTSSGQWSPASLLNPPRLSV